MRYAGNDGEMEEEEKQEEEEQVKTNHHRHRNAMIETTVPGLEGVVLHHVHALPGRSQELMTTISFEVIIPGLANTIPSRQMD